MTSERDIKCIKFYLKKLVKLQLKAHWANKAIAYNFYAEHVARWQGYLADIQGTI